MNVQLDLADDDLVQLFGRGLSKVHVHVGFYEKKG
jgi:hypothetical protein